MIQRSDAKLQHRARLLLLKQAKKLGLKLRQSYIRLGKQALFRGSRYAAAKQMKRARKQFKLVTRYLGCVYRDVQRQLEKKPDLAVQFNDLLEKTEKLLTVYMHQRLSALPKAKLTRNMNLELRPA